MLNEYDNITSDKIYEIASIVSTFFTNVGADIANSINMNNQF